MTVLSIITEDNEVTFTSYTGTGPLSFTFPYFQKEDLVVSVNGTDLADSDWDDTPNSIDGGNDGGSIILNTAVAAATVNIRRDTVRLRASQFSAGGASSRQVDTEFNRLVTMVQDTYSYVARVLNAVSTSALNTVIAGLSGKLDIPLANYAALTSIAAAARSDGMTLYVKARTTKGDGGEGWWRFDAASSATANGGTILAPDAGSGRWLRIAEAGVMEFEWFGAIDASGATSSNTAVQAAVTVYNADTSFRAIRARIATYRVTSAMTFTRPVHLYGTKPEQTSTGIGTWFHFDHLGKGIHLSAPGSQTFGSILESFGTRRSQPTAGGGWAPVAADWDIDAEQEGGTHEIRDLFIFNATKGIVATGRCLIYNIFGQAFDRFIDLPYSLDVTRVWNCHQWPFWSSDSNVTAYMIDNLQAYRLGRADNCILSGCFSLFANIGLHLYTTADGVANKLKVSDCDFDICKEIVKVTSSGNTVQFSAFSGQCVYEETGSQGVIIDGSNNIIRFESVSLSGSQGRLILVNSTGNKIRINQAELREWDLSLTSVAAVEVATGNEITFSQMPDYVQTVRGTLSGGSFSASTAFFSGSGTAKYAPIVGEVNAGTDGSGDVTVTHGYPFSPKQVFVQLRAPGVAYYLRVESVSASTFKVRVYDAAGAAVTSSATLTIFWQVF